MAFLARALFVWLALTSLSCRAPVDPACQSLFEKGDFEEASALCGENYQETGNPEAGLTAAKASAELDDEAAVLEWSHRLSGTRVEPTLLGMLIEIQQERNEYESLVDTYQRLAAVHESSGSYRDAFDAYHDLFYLAWERSRYRQALDFTQKSSALAEATNDDHARVSSLEMLFNLLYDMGDLESALRTLRHEAELLPPDDVEGSAWLLVNESIVRMDQGRMNAALDALDRALVVGAELENPTFFRSVHLNMVLAYLSLDRIEEAGHHIAQAWEYAPPELNRQIALLYFESRVETARGEYGKARESIRLALEHDPIPVFAWDLEYELGRIEEALGSPPDAQRAYGRAIEIIEDLRASIRVDDFKSWIIDRLRKPYEALFRLQAASGRVKEALATLENVKARTFEDALVRAASQIDTAAMDPSAAAAERIEMLESLLPPIRESAAVAPRPVDEVLQLVGERHVLAYFVSEEALWLVQVSSGRVKLHYLSDSMESVEREIQAFENDVENPQRASQLGSLLLPDAALPAEGGTIHIVTDGVLGRLPFAVLRKDGRYLVEDYVVTYVPSLNAMAGMASRPSQSRGEPVILADAKGDLREALLEAREVAEKLGAEPRSGAQATLSVLLSASQASVLHLATHSGLSHRGPWLDLADGRVEASQILESAIRPRLAVLASCKSATGTRPDVWGSLGSFFLAAGSESVLATQRSVGDRFTHEFIVRFYENGGPKNAAAALARTQRDFIARGESPARWGLFVHLGLQE